MKKMARQLPFLLCIILGTILLLYPMVKDRYESYQQQKILKQWQENLQQLDKVSPEPEPEEIAVIDTHPPVTSIEGAAAEAIAAAPLNVEPAPAKQPVLEGTEGVLIIGKIDLKLPILTNATNKNLDLSVASIANTGKVGAIGNYAIAGHRNLTYGKNFNRLDEVAVGDRIEVDTGSKQYEYEVEKKQYVLPEDVWVLKGNGKDREITLITCHPMKNPTHRLIIKGKLVENKG